MASFDDSLNVRKGPVRQALDMDPIRGVLDRSTERYDRTADEGAIGMRSATSTRTTGGAPRDGEFEPVEFAMNDATGEIALPNGKVIKASAPIIMQIATLTSDDGAPLPRMTSVPKGFRPVTQAQIKSIVDSIPTESDFWGEAWANGKTTLGLAASAIDSLIGNDDPSNAWAKSAQELENTQTLGELKGSRGRWYSSFDSFISGLGQTAGNVGGTVVGAIPVAAAGAGVGAVTGGGVGSIPGGLLGAGLAVSGGASAYGEQATEFYEDAIDAMSKMDEATLEAESPMYREILREDPNITHEEAMREVAIRGARAAGGAAGLLGAVEGMVGGKLAGNFLARMGVTKSLLGAPLDAVAKRAGIAGTAGRVAGRSTLGALGAGAEEMAETAFGQAAGARATGIGNDDPRAHLDIEEGIAAAQGGAIFGGLGGRARRSAVEQTLLGEIIDPKLAAENSDLGAALQYGPNTNTEWSRAPQLTHETDAIPAAQRRGTDGSRPGALGGPGFARVAEGELDKVEAQIAAVLAERFGPEWIDDVDRIANHPEGRQFIGQLIDIGRQRRELLEEPAYQRGYAQGPVPAGQPDLRGAAFGDPTLRLDGNPQPSAVEQQGSPVERQGFDPNQQQIPGMEYGPQDFQPEPRGEQAPTTLPERREMQRIAQEERAAASAQNPAALPQAPSRALEQQIYDLDDQIEELDRVLAQRREMSPRGTQTQRLKAERDRLQALMDQLEEQWVAQREQEGPSGVAPGAQVEAPDPEAAPTERTPDGRPMGVAPAPLVNPDPLTPPEAEARAATQAERGVQVTPEQVAAQAQGQAAEQVLPSTPEPAQDIAAQVEAMVDPASGRDAVFVAPDTRPPTNLPKNVIVVTRPGTGTLLTTNRKKAQEFRTKKLTDAVLQRILGYSEPKAAAVASGAPVAVQAVKDGAVQAEQAASPKGVPAAKKAVAKQAQPGARVRVTTPEKVQQRRAQPPKAAAAIAKSKERSTPKKRPAKKPDDEEKTTRVRKEQLDDRTRDEKKLAQQGPKAEAAAPAAAAADTVERAAARPAQTVSHRGERLSLPATVVASTGQKGSRVDMRVLSPDSAAASRIGTALRSGTLTPDDRAKAEGWVTGYRQIKTMLDAAVAAAEEKLKPMVEAAGEEFGREAEKTQAELETEMTGKKVDKPSTSPIAYLPLVIEETRGFLRAVRAEAKAELDSYQPAHSVARQMISAISGKYEALLQDPREGKRVLKAFAELTDEQLKSVLDATHLNVRDSTVAKQAMRGATEVAHAFRRMEAMSQTTSQSFSLPDSANHEDVRKLSHSTEHGPVPLGMRGVLNGWVRNFEKGGHKFSAPIQLMSMKDAMALRPGAFTGNRVPNGKYLRITDANGKVERHVLAVAWDRYTTEAAALEVLAHEFGHAITTEMYARSSPRVRKQIDLAYDNWLRRQQGKSVDDILRSQMPEIERAAFPGGATDRAYATKFWEWAARNAALYVLDPNRPHLSVVEKFFKAIADVMRNIYTAIMNPKTDAAWDAVMDDWIAGTAQVYPMPQMPEGNFNHEMFADDAQREPAGPSKALAQRATEAIAPLRTLFEGGPRGAYEAANDSKAGELTGRLGLSLMTLRQIERKYRDTPLGAPLSAWTRLQQQKAKTANAMMEEGSRWIERANQLDPRVRATLEQVMYRATHFGVHPELPFTDKANKHLVTGNARVDAVNEQRYRTTRNDYNSAVKADPRVADIYAGLRDAFVDLHKKTLAKQLELVQHSDFSQKVKDQISERIKAAQREMRLGPYFPLMRFGNWIVKVQLPAQMLGQGGKEGADWFATKAEAREEARNQRALNPGSQVAVEKVEGEPGYGVRVYQKGVYFFDSAKQAADARKDIEAEVRENYTVAGVDFDEAQGQFEDTDDGDGAGKTKGIISQPYGAIDDFEALSRSSPEFASEVRSLVKEGKLDPEVAATLERLAIEALPENNYRHSLLPRQNIFGASKQMLRAYAHRFQGAAHHYSAVEHGQPISKNWAKMRAVREEFKPAAAVYNNLLANQQEIRNRMSGTTANKVANFITDASSMFSLGFSPAYVLTNSLQPWTVTLPTLAGLTKRDGSSVGAVKAGKYLKDAYAGAMPFFTKRGFAEFIDEAKALAGQRGTSSGLQDTAQEILTKFSKTPEEEAMLKSLLERGTLDFSWLNSLEDAMRSGKAGQKWANLQRLGMAFPQQVETMNRVVTALASYRLAKDERLTAEDSEPLLQEFADDTVADTQLDYSRMNRPLAFNKPGLSVILQFKLYMQGMYMLFVRNAALAMRGATPEQRKQGRRTISYLLASHAAAAGAAGLGPASWMAKMALVAFAAATPDDDDDWKSGEQLLSEMMTDLFGEYAGEVAERGLPALAGIDMSDRIGLPVIYDARFAGTKVSDPAATTMDKMVIYGLGAPYSNARRVVSGVAAAADGDFDKAVNGLPTAARSIARSMKWAKDGVVDQNGDTFIPREDLDWGDLALNTLGLSPTTTSKAYRDRTEVKETTARIMEQRKALLQAARTDKDVADEISEFNRKVPRPFRISQDQIAASRKSKEARERGEASKQEGAVRRLLGQ